MAQLLTDPITRSQSPRNIAAFLREPLIALELRNTVNAAGNAYAYQKIAAPNYVIQAGDVLRYDVWVDPMNPAAASGGVEINLTAAPGYGRSVPLADQNGVAAINANPASVGAWFSRAVSLAGAGVVGNTISAVDLVNEGDALGNYRALYRNIRITDTAGTTLRVTLWNGGAPALNSLDVSALNANILVTPYDAPGWTGDPAQVLYKFGTKDDLRVGIWHEGNLAAFPAARDNASPDTGVQSGGAFAVQIVKPSVASPPGGITQAQWLAMPLALIGKVMEFELVSQVSRAGVPVREIIDVRRATVKAARISGNAMSIQFADIDLSALQKPYPFYKFATADFPRLFAGHVGRPVNDGVGQLLRLPLSYLDNGVTGTGPYIFGVMEKRAGFVYTVQTVYRSESDGAVGRVVPAAEYTVGNSGPYTGGWNLNTISFAREQKSASGQLYSLSADIFVSADTSGTVTDSRVVGNELKFLLGKAGITVDAASFATAATNAVAASMFCDAGYVAPRTLMAIVNDMLMLARGDLIKTATGAFAIVQDVARASVGSWSEADDEAEVLDFSVRDKPAAISLYYRPAISGGEAWNIQPRTRTPAGLLPEKRYYNPYIYDHTTADKLCDYLSKRDSIQNQAQLKIHAAQFDLRDLLTFTGVVSWAGDKNWLIDAVSRPADCNVLDVTEYDAAVYIYTAAALPAGATNGYTPDYSQTPPLAPASVVVVSQGVNTSADGTALAYALVRVAPPANANWATLIALATDNTTGEIKRGVCRLSGANYEVTLEGLRPSRSYAVIAFAVNAAGLEGATAAVAGSNVTSSNTPAPAAPTGLTAIDISNRQVKWEWFRPVNASIIRFRFEHNVAGAGWVTALGDSAATFYNDGPFAVGTTVQGRVYSIDRNGVESAASVATSITTTLQVGATDIGNNAVTAPAINAGAVSAAKLGAGVGANLLTYSTFATGPYGWSITYNSSGITPTLTRLAAGDANSFNGETLAVTMASAPANGAQINISHTAFIGVAAGAWYEASTYVAAVNCGHRIEIAFYNAAGGLVGVPGTPNTAGLNLAGNVLTNYARPFVIAQAPAGAVKMQVNLQITFTGAASPAIYTTRAFFGEANANQTEPSPWSPAGVTTIDGAVILAGSLKTSNYTEDGGGNPTAGAKLDHTGTAIKVKSGSLQVGSVYFTDYWARQYQAIDGSMAGGIFVWRGNNDTTTRGGAPNIDCLSIQLNNTDQPVSNGSIQLHWDYVLQPTALTDNLDSMVDMTIDAYPNAGGAAPVFSMNRYLSSRKYYNTTHGNALNAARGSFNYLLRTGASGSGVWYNSASPFTFFGHLLVTINNVYGPSAQRWFHGSGSVANTVGTSMLRDSTAPAGAPAPGSGGGGGGLGAGCPAPWVQVALINGRAVAAGDLYNGARVQAVNDTDLKPIATGGVIRDLRIEFKQRVRISFTSGKVSEYSMSHRLAVADRGWVEIQHLRRGDVLVALEESIVDSVVAVGEGQVVVFSVEGAGTYFSDGVLSHNAKVIP